jgi:hypothetical protein
MAGADEAQAIADSDASASDREGFNFTGFDRVQLCTLLSLLKSGGAYSDFEPYLDTIDVVTASADEWPVVSIVKTERVSELAAVAAMEPDEFESLARLWEATEEFAGWSNKDVRDLLKQLGDLAELASLSGQCIMIWQEI